MNFKDKMIFLPLVVVLVFEIFGLITAATNVTGFTPGAPPAGNSTQIPVPNYGVSVNFGVLWGLIGSIAGVALLVALIGLKILGSGLGERAYHVLSSIILYVAIWLLCSSYALSQMVEIPFLINGAASILYVLLTVFYAAGAFLRTMSNSSGGDVSD